MKITNVNNLPQSIVNAVTFSEHRKGSGYSATEILKPVKIIHLSRRHDSELIEDCSNRIWALLGSAVHSVLERGADKNTLQEQFLTSKVLGVELSGSPDLLDNDGNLSDYKITSAWSVVYGSRTKEWENQLNIYIWLFAQHGFEVKKANIICIFRDWSELKAKSSDNYPVSTVISLPVKIWTTEKQLSFIEERINNIEFYKDMPDDKLPLCSAEEMWEKDKVFAVKKTGRKSAIKLFNSMAEAEANMLGLKGDNIEIRNGERTRCEKYCSVNKFCEQYKLYKGEKDNA